MEVTGEPVKKPFVPIARPGAFEPYQKGRQPVVRVDTPFNTPTKTPSPKTKEPAKTLAKIHHLKRVLDNGEEVMMVAIDKNLVHTLMLNGFKNLFPEDGEAGELETLESNLNHVIVAPAALRPEELLIVHKGKTPHLFYQEKDLLGVYVQIKRYFTHTSFNEEKLFIWPTVDLPDNYLNPIRDFNERLPHLPLHIPLPTIAPGLPRYIENLNIFEQEFYQQLTDDRHLRKQLDGFWPGNVLHQRDVMFKTRIDGPFHKSFLVSTGQGVNAFNTANREKDYGEHCVICFFAVTRGLKNPHYYLGPTPLPLPLPLPQ